MTPEERKQRHQRGKIILAEYDTLDADLATRAAAAEARERQAYTIYAAVRDEAHACHTQRLDAMLALNKAMRELWDEPEAEA